MNVILHLVVKVDDNGDGVGGNDLNLLLSNVDTD
jgi:hypothetical protein